MAGEICTGAAGPQLNRIKVAEMFDRMCARSACGSGLEERQHFVRRHGTGGDALACHLVGHPSQ